jgi:ribonucleoside-diphosphate reductase alpha chain
MPAAVSDNALTILRKRYFDKTAGEDTPSQMWKRCSGGSRDYEEMLSELLFLPNSPTLFNLGTSHGGTLSACFVFSFEDSLRDGSRSIMATLDKAAAVAKAGGGVGYYFGNLRGRGSLVRSTHRHACGPVEVMRMCNRLSKLITQGGKRDLAQMGVLNSDHPDIEEFISCKDSDPQGIGSFNISVSWKDDHLKGVDSRSESAPDRWTSLWWKQCHSAWRTGDPGMLFFDAINRANATPHLGSIQATNPCGETPNLCDEPCNLGSLALRRFVKKVNGKHQIDWQKLEYYARLATRYLDDVLDWNSFPHPDIDHMARHTRKLGLGVMGWADLLALLRIPYDTQDAVDLGDELWGKCSQWATEESVKMADTKGPYPAYSPETAPVWAPRARNSTRTSIAPTGTISIIADCSSGIEPHYALEWERTTYEGIKMTERIPVWSEIGDFRPKTAAEVGIEWHIRHQAVFQKHTDLGVSKTINLPNSATVQDVSDAYRLMWKTGCKGGTIFRDGCRAEQVLVAKGDKTKSVYMTGAEPAEGAEKKRRRLFRRRKGETTKFVVAKTEGYYTANTYDDGTLGEIFVLVSNQGSTLNGFLDAWAKTFSLALQWNTPLQDLVNLHKFSRFEPAGLTGDPDVPICTSIIDFIVQDLERKFLKKVEDKGHTGTGQYCPDCSTELVRKDGCYCCPAERCGYSRCG